MTRKFLFFLILITVSHKLSAEPVDTALACKVARNFYFQNSQYKSLGEINAKLVFTYNSNELGVRSSEKGAVNIEKNNENLYFIYNINNEGFVIVAGDDDAKPVLGYSKEGIYLAENMPPAFIDLMSNYSRQILNIKQNNLKADHKIQDEWKRMENGESKIDNKSKGEVGPLLTTKWNQTTYYNAYCPIDRGKQVVTGCVATAMAQIMKYWNHPNKGTGHYSYYHPLFGELSANFGNTKYDWANMPNALGKTSSPSEVKAVAKLNYDCGISVNMDYNVEGSGANMAVMVIKSLKNYFYYSASAQIVSKYDYNDTDWISLLESELINNRPMQCQGYNNISGHAFVCDGFDNNDYLHYNWGWGGVADGFFSADNLNPAGTNFDYNQKAIINIQPITIPEKKIELNSNIDIIPDTIIYNKAFSIKTNIKNSDTSAFYGHFAAFLYDINDNYYFIDSTGNDTLYAGEHFNDLTFSSKGISAATLGTYKLGILYRSATGNWLLADSTNYKNLVNVNIISSNSRLKLLSSINISKPPIEQNKAFDISTKILNTGSRFHGDISYVLFSEAGDSLKSIATSSNVVIDSAAEYSLSFNAITSDAEHGKYLLSVLYNEKNSNWKQVSSGDYSNPVQLLITPQYFLTPDKYEPNNTKNYAFNLPVVFIDDSANIKTEGANIHISGDVDYYKIMLSSDYNYLITAGINDKNNPADGQKYTTNAFILYMYNSFWSVSYYDYQNINFEISDGGTVYFRIYSSYSSETGTYLLDLKIKRILKNAIYNLDFGIKKFTVYPNPANSMLIVSYQLTDYERHSGGNMLIYDCMGKLYSKFNFQSSENIKIDLSDYSNGIYFLEAIINNKSYYKRFIVCR